MARLRCWGWCWLLIGLALPAAAQQAASGNVGSPDTIAVSVQGTARTEPDTAVVNLAIAGRSLNLKDAYAQAQHEADQVRSIFGQQGIAPAQATWSGYQVQPQVDYRNHRITDYNVTETVQLQLKDFAKIGPLVNAFGSAGLDALRGVSFERKDLTAAKAAAIADGYHQAQSEAQALAAAAGRQISGLERASVDVSYAGPMPVPLMRAAMAGMAAEPAPTQEFTPQAITVTARLTLTFRLRP